MAVAFASSSFAVVTCTPKSDDGLGLVTIPVVSTNALIGVPVIVTRTGGVIIDMTECTDGVSACNIYVQGTPSNSGNQYALFNITDADDTYGLLTGCFAGRVDGLPVEVSTFTVE